MMFLAQNSFVEYGSINHIDCTGPFTEQSIVMTDGNTESINMFKQVELLNNSGSIITSLIHTHPEGTIPSGFNADFSGYQSDKSSRDVYNKMLNPAPLQFVCSVPGNIFYRYDNANTVIFESYVWKNCGFISNGKKTI